MRILKHVTQQLIKIKKRSQSNYLVDRPSKFWINGIPNINEALHGNPQHPKSTVTKWFGMDTEKAFDKVSPPHADWNFTKDNVNYTFNSLGYRGSEPDKDADYKVLLVGDSHGFGVGLDDKQIWAHQFKMLLQEQYANCNIINCSLPGGSNDWISRLISCAIETVKPDCVIVCYTYPNRREAIWDSGYLWQLNMTIPDNDVQTEYEEFQSWFMTVNEHSDEYNLVKNQKLVQAMCKSTLLIESNVTQMHIIERDITKNLNYIDVARDLSHFGPLVHRKFARYMFDKFIRKHDVT